MAFSSLPLPSNNGMPQAGKPPSGFLFQGLWRLQPARCYRKGFDHEKVKEILLEEEGTYFDPEVIKAFLVLEDKFSHI
jgi:hypothetical protein